MTVGRPGRPGVEGLGTRVAHLAAVLALTTMVLAACGGDEDEDTGGATPSGGPIATQGTGISTLCLNAIIDSVKEPTTANQFWKQIACTQIDFNTSALEASISRENRADEFCGAVEIGAGVAGPIVEGSKPKGELSWVGPLLEVVGFLCPVGYKEYIDDILVTLE